MNNEFNNTNQGNNLNTNPILKKDSKSNKGILVFVIILLISVLGISWIVKQCMMTIHFSKPIYDGDNPKFVNDVKDSIENPKDSLGLFVTINARVIGVETTKKYGQCINAYAFIGNDKIFVKIFCNDKCSLIEEKSNVNGYGYFNVTGYISTVIKNRGRDIDEAGITLTDGKSVSEKEFFNPTLKAVDYNKTITQKDYEITINRVEFSSKETRIYLSAHNKGINRFHISDDSFLLKQDDNSYIGDNSIQYKNISSIIESGQADDCIIVFPAIKQSNFTLRISGNVVSSTEELSDKNIYLDDYFFDLDV